MGSKNPILSFWQKSWGSKLVVVIVGVIILSAIINAVIPSQSQKAEEDKSKTAGAVESTKGTSTPSKSPVITKKPEQTQTPTPTRTPTATPIATPKADSKSSQAKQVSTSVFKKFFMDNFDYQQFTKAFGTSDKWDFWESFNPDDDHLILGVTGDDLKSGILKASPNEISSIQIVSFFQMGYPPLVSSGWVEKAVSNLKPGDTRQTVIDNVSAKITLTYANIWIVSFIEE